MKEQWVIERLNRKGESVHYIANAFYLMDDYVVTNYDGAHRFPTYDDAQRCGERIAARGISIVSLDIVPVS